MMLNLKPASLYEFQLSFSKTTFSKGSEINIYTHKISNIIYYSD